MFSKSLEELSKDIDNIFPEPNITYLENYELMFSYMYIASKKYCDCGVNCKCKSRNLETVLGGRFGFRSNEDNSKNFSIDFIGGKAFVNTWNFKFIMAGVLRGRMFPSKNMYEIATGLDIDCKILFSELAFSIGVDFLGGYIFGGPNPIFTATIQPKVAIGCYF